MKNVDKILNSVKITGTPINIEDIRVGDTIITVYSSWGYLINSETELIYYQFTPWGTENKYYERAVSPDDYSTLKELKDSEIGNFMKVDRSVVESFLCMLELTT